jgi:hypothetical protein
VPADSSNRKRSLDAFLTLNIRKVNLITRCGSEKLIRTEYADVLSSINEKVCELYGISQSELFQR